MKNFKLTTILLVFLPLLCFSQYTWEQVAMPDSIGADSICFYDNDIYLSTGNGVYHSNDNCESWEYIGLGQYPIWSIHISQSGNLYAGASSRIFRYAGNCQWDLLYTTEEASNILSIYESDNGHIFFGNWGGIFRSTDGGINWTEVLDLYNTEVVNAIAENSEGELFAGSTSFSGDISPGGIYSSTDGGATWQLTGLNYHFVSSVVINANDEIFVGTRGHWTNGGGGVFKSVDNGNTWETSYSNILVNALTLNNYDEIAFSCPMESYPYGGVHLSVDGGDTWSNITGNLPGNYLNGVAYDNNSILYAIGLYGDLFRTETPVNISQHQFAQHDSFTVYPNPAKDKLNLIINKYNIEKIYITDLSGKLIKNMRPLIGENGVEINISDLPPSVYLIHCKSDHNISTVKFIKF